MAYTSPVTPVPSLTLPLMIPSGSPAPFLNASQSPMSPITPMSPIPSIQSSLAQFIVPPMLSIIPSTKQTDSAHANLPATLPLGHVNVTALQNDLEFYQNGYYSLKAKFDGVCDIIKQNEQKLQEKDAQIHELKNSNLAKEIRKLEYKVKRLETDRDACSIQMENLQKLYLNPTHIRKFKSNIQKYGEQMGTLKDRQYKLTQCIGKEKMESIKVRMGALHRDMATTEATYTKLFSSLDEMKRESAAKELELRNKATAEINFLQNDKDVKATTLQRFEKEIRNLQAELADRDMKLRKKENELERMKNCNASPMMRPRLRMDIHSY